MVNTMFKKPQLLNKEKDKEIKISELKDFKHAKKAHFMPLAKDEVNEACKHYPVFFVNEAEEQAIPIALLGIQENINLFVNKPGEWEAGRYIPALIRSYPFSLSKQGDDNYSLVFDAEYEGLDQKEGKRLLEDNGEPTEYGNQVVGFVQRVYADLDRTRALTKIIKDLDIFKQVNATIEKEEQKYQINGLLQVDVEKLNKLSDEQLLNLTKTGAMNLIYSHLISLTNFDNLGRKLK